MNAYLGYQQYTFDPAFACFNIFLIILLGLIIPKSLIKPTDSFLFFYLLIAIFPYLLFNSVRRHEINFSYLVEVALLLFPFLCCTFFSFFISRINIPSFELISSEKTLILFASLTTLGTLIALNNPTASASFGIEDVYIRRIEGREIYPTGSLQAYINAMIMNGLCSFLAFYSAWKKKWMYILVAIACWISFFYLLGVKAPLFLIALSSYLGVIIRKKKSGNFFTHVAYAMLSVLFLTLFEIYFFQLLLYCRLFCKESVYSTSI